LPSDSGFAAFPGEFDPPSTGRRTKGRIWDWAAATLSKLGPRVIPTLEEEMKKGKISDLWLIAVLSGIGPESLPVLLQFKSFCHKISAFFRGPRKASGLPAPRLDRPRPDRLLNRRSDPGKIDALRT